MGCVTSSVGRRARERRGRERCATPLALADTRLLYTESSTYHSITSDAWLDLGDSLLLTHAKGVAPVVWTDWRGGAKHGAKLKVRLAI